MGNGGLNSFSYRGKCSLDFGLVVYEKTAYAAPARDVQVITIPGRSGDLILDNGRYENIEIKYACHILPERRFESPAAASRGIKGWLLSERGYFRLTDTCNADYFRLAAYHAAAQIDGFTSQVGTVPVVFNCKPFLYAFAGQTPVTFTAPGALYNAEAFPSAPYIKITGSGDITLTINNDAFAFSGVEEYIEVDSEIMNAYKGITPQNSKMAAPRFPALYPGKNNISWTGGATAVEIVPRWCAL